MPQHTPPHFRSARAVLQSGVLASALMAGAVWASSPAAWSAHDREVAAACVKASGLTNAQAVGQPMAYDDSIGFTALLVAGRYPQPHMKNRPGKVLCLFDRKKREASVIEADQLSVKVLPKPAKK